MDYTLQQRSEAIVSACLQMKTKNPAEIFQHIANQDFVRIHGPEHHILDGAAILTAFYNAGGDIDLAKSLEELMCRGMQMPGATCGQWGVCGAVTSIGAALSIIDGTGPLSTDESWGNHMHFTSAALGKLADVGGPRCCKRDAFFTMEEAINYISVHYNVSLEMSAMKCSYSNQNQQCIRLRCPFYKKKVAFICVHNSCRSQIAEALGKKYLSEKFECFSAGTETKPQINQDAVRIMKDMYGIDMEQGQYSKLLSDIPSPDIAISMGCNVSCPFIGRGFDDDWGLEDPTGKSDEEFVKIIKEIEKKILALRE